MRSRAVRVTLTLLTMAAIGAAAYFSWTVHTRARAEQQTAATFDHTRIAAIRQAYELRSAQQAYVAAGQNHTFWSGKVSEALESLRAATTTLRSSTTSGAALASLEETAAAIDEFDQVDRRARGYVTGGQLLLASDIIFTAGLEAAGGITTALERTGLEVAESAQAEMSDGRRRQALAVGGATAFALLALLLLMPVGTTPAQSPVAAVPEPAPGADGLRLREDVGAPERRAANRDNREIPGRKAAASAGPGAAQPLPRPAPSPVQQTVELQGLAAVCTDLARLSDTSLLPEILERAAAALDATGLVLWLADQDGTLLVPIATHGYPASVVARMGSLKVDAENATSAAFRTGMLQTVIASANSSGAMAVPVLASTGCRGVMSAEVRTDARTQPGRLAAAAILAAQLATLVGPPAAESRTDRNTAAL